MRALTRAIVLGSGAGLVIGVVYLAGSGGHASQAPARAPAPRSGPVAAVSPPHTHDAASPTRLAATAIAAPVKAAPASLVPAAHGLDLQALRDRIRLASVALSAPAAPFHAQQGADADLHCLAEAVYFEARGEERPGQQAVAQVVLNRVRHPAFPKTICAVVHQRTAGGCQFSFACGGRQAQTGGEAWRRAQTVAAEEMHGAVMTAVGDATHFQTARAGAFNGLLKVAQIGAHVFYRFAGHAGAAGMFHPSPSPSVAPPQVQLAQLDVPALPSPVKPVVESARPAPAASITGVATARPAMAAPKPTPTQIVDPKPAAPGEAAAFAGSASAAVVAKPPAPAKPIASVTLAQS